MRREERHSGNCPGRDFRAALRPSKSVVDIGDWQLTTDERQMTHLRVRSLIGEGGLPYCGGKRLLPCGSWLLALSSWTSCLEAEPKSQEPRAKSRGLRPAPIRLRTPHLCSSVFISGSIVFFPMHSVHHVADRSSAPRRSPMVGEHTALVGEHTAPFGEHTLPFGVHTLPFGEQTPPFGEQTLPFGERKPPIFDHFAKTLTIRDPKAANTRAKGNHWRPKSVNSRPFCDIFNDLQEWRAKKIFLPMRGIHGYGTENQG